LGDAEELSSDDESAGGAGTKRSKPKNNEWGMTLVNRLGGYAHLLFVDHSAVHAEDVRAPESPSMGDDLYRDWVHDKPESPTSGTSMGFFGPDLPTVEQAEQAKKKRNLAKAKSLETKKAGKKKQGRGR
jgi:hypothetical protein